MDVRQLLEAVKKDEIDIDTAVNKLKDLPYEDLGYANIDHHRELRNGFPEVIYCEGKTDEHIIGIVDVLLKKQSNVLGTRCRKETAEKLKEIYDNVEYDELSRVLMIKNHEIKNRGKGTIAILAAGTSDISVADEAYYTAKFLGNNVERIYDVGVAGIHRLLNKRHLIEQSRVVVAVAGMVDVPVIAVPTSVGYGASFNGLTALLAMLNSCASGISVVNIDNGFGAGYLAATINKLK